ncbi:Mitochondrial zinc maintenance protein 1, mitochondrial [Ascosphaera atra]|nr:Mitochondrial zinc maintenance protein 1, mitochondrial [Ascosphaera atra]
MATPTPSPLAAYRHLLRATRIAFYGDWPTMHAARNEARARFDANKVATVDTAMKIQEAEEAARILRHNIVQGRLVAEAEQAAAEGNAEKERELRYRE